jgi:hypothetical protein
MSNSTSKILQILTWVLMGITIVFAGIFYLGDVVPGTEGTRLEEPVITQSFLVWAAILLFLTAGITVVFSIINFIVNPKGGKKTLVSFVFGIVVIVIAFLMADDTVLNMPYYDGKDNVPGMLKLADTVLFTSYMLIVVAFLAIIVSAVSRLFRK